MMADPPVFGSLRRRLVITLIGGAAVLAVLLYLAVRSYAVQVAAQGQDNILRASAASILDAAAIRDGAIEVDIPYAAFSMLATPADDRVFYAIFQDGEFLSGYEDLRSAGQSEAFQSLNVRGEIVRQVNAQRTLIGGGQRVEIEVALAQTQDALAATLDRISRNVGILGAGFFALAAALSVWGASATMGQLDRLTSAVTRRGPQDLRPFDRPVPEEMAPLVASLNSLMGRLDHSLSQSEDFIAEAAHRVRTPLATVRSYAEATLQRVDKEENREAMRAMIRAIDESSRAAGQLLDHAMITFRADHLDRQDIDLTEQVRDLVDRLTPIAEMRDMTLQVTGQPHVPCAGDPILIQNALRNLIDNAMKYGPVDGQITIAVTSDPRPCVTVCDQGPGFPDAEIGMLTARFQRGGNASDTIGSGLGLTIALDVATAHGGTLTLSNREEGGACVALSL